MRTALLTQYSPWSIQTVLSSEQPYITKNWNYERADRYIVKSSFGILEASYFQHLKDGKNVKCVVELPTSYGCPVRCAHCASGDIATVRRLDAEDLVQICELVTRAKDTFDVFPLRVVAFSGIGECSLNMPSVFSFCRQHSQKYQQDQFILTTAGIRPSFIEEVDELAGAIPIRWLQITLLHNDVGELTRVMGRGFQKFDFDSLTNTIAKVRNVKIRVNYVVIDKFNSDKAIVSAVAERLKILANNITIRVSQLNETDTSRGNGLCQPSADTVRNTQAIFSSFGLSAYSFMSTFNDNMNCGQLAWKYRP